MLDDKTLEKAANKFIPYLLPKNYISCELRVIHPGFPSEDTWVQLEFIIPKSVEYDYMVAGDIIKNIQDYFGVEISLMGVVLIKQN